MTGERMVFYCKEEASQAETRGAVPSSRHHGKMVMDRNELGLLQKKAQCLWTLVENKQGQKRE